jgi:hypothetical protein
MSKYEPLARHLAGRADAEWVASFAEVERVLGAPLPKAARNGGRWWANRDWAGWEAGDVDVGAERVVFRRPAGESDAPALADEAQSFADRLPATTGRSQMPAGVIAAGLAVVAGLGVLTVRALTRRR